jgi:hypothetical protein
MIPGMIRRGRRSPLFVFFVVDDLRLVLLLELFVALFLLSLDPTDDDIEDRKALIVLRTNKTKTLNAKESNLDFVHSNTIELERIDTS